MAYLEIAWTQTRATAREKSQQRPPDPPVPAPNNRREIVFACLEQHPCATMRRLHELTGLSMQDVNGALYALLKANKVTRSHRQQDNHGVPVQWRVRS